MTDNKIPQKSMSEVLTNLINFIVERNPDNFHVLDEFHSMLFYAEQLKTMKGQKYFDGLNTLNSIKIRLISKISQL